MSKNPLREALSFMAAAPHSAGSLTLYALVATLEQETAGCLFKLDKLRDLDESGRQIAYGLMELMVAGGNVGDEWNGLKQQMDQLIRHHFGDSAG